MDAAIMVTVVMATMETTTMDITAMDGTIMEMDMETILIMEITTESKRQLIHTLGTMEEA